MLHLATAEDRNTTGLHYAQWHIPAGDYVAAFRDDGGVYYQPPTPIILHGLPAGTFVFGRHALYNNGKAIVIYFEPKLPFAEQR